jgi:uncharacterized protein YbaP (TraB family)
MKNLFLFLLFPFTLGAQSSNSLLWEISGNGMESPSYVFGTYHLITSTFIDSFPVIMQSLQKTKAIVGELVIDASVQQKVMDASVMKDSSLDQLMSAEDYKLVADYFKEQVGMELSFFKKMKPVIISTFFYTPIVKKNKGTAMDIYFQEKGKEGGKEVLGLETVDDQIKTLFGGMSLKRQADMLVKSVKEKDKTQREMLKMDSCYRRGDLDCLANGIKDDDSYSVDEMEQLLYSRNANWIKELPEMMKKRPLFIAVGAGHLPGDKGLLNLLAQQGFTIKKVPLN